MFITAYKARKTRTRSPEPASRNSARTRLVDVAQRLMGARRQGSREQVRYPRFAKGSRRRSGGTVMTLAGISISPTENGRAHCRALMGVTRGAWGVRRQSRSDPVRLGALQPWCIASSCPCEKHGAGADGLESVELPRPRRRHCRLSNSHRPRSNAFAYCRPRPPRVKKVT